jgi:hypothetical protein
MEGDGFHACVVLEADEADERTADRALVGTPEQANGQAAPTILVPRADVTGASHY